MPWATEPSPQCVARSRPQLGPPSSLAGLPQQSSDGLEVGLPIFTQEDSEETRVYNEGILSVSTYYQGKSCVSIPHRRVGAAAQDVGCAWDYL